MNCAVEKMETESSYLEKADSGVFPMPKAMSLKTFRRFRDYITVHLGIKMPDTKKTMLQSRLQKRLRALRLRTYEEYFDYVFSDQGHETELAHMIDAITTNKTDFFREPRHFEYLVQNALPELIANPPKRIRNIFRFWSAGCSTGAEPYTLAMVLSEFARKHEDFRFTILATDISTKVLNAAAMGIYKHEIVEPIPMALRKTYLLRSKERNQDIVRVVPKLRSKVSFRRLNFMDEDFGLRLPVEMIFCRNVLIYFSRSTQEKVINRLCRYLDVGGYLFVGHSETLNGLDVPLIQVSPTIYRKRRRM